MLDVVVFLVSLGVRAIRAMCRHRADLVLENVALRQQVTALKKERPRPLLDDTERAFWVALRGSWPVGIATDSDGTGQRSRSAAIPVGLGLMPRFVASSARWRKTAGGRRRSGVPTL